MTLDELVSIRSQINSLTYEAKSREHWAEKIAHARNSGEHALFEAIRSVTQYEPASAEIHNVLRRAVAALRDDILRMAELDLEAQARSMKAQVKAKEGQLKAFFGEPKQEAV